MNLEEKQLTTERKFQGRIISLYVDDVRLPDGKTADREYVRHPGGVCVAALTDEGEVLTVKQYRYPYHEIIEEIPAGKRDSSGEDPLDCGKRELKEEAGATAEHFRLLGTLYPSPGYTDEVIYLYAAWGLSFGETNPDEDEFLTLHKVPLDTMVERILSGEIKDAKTQAAVLKLKLLVDKGEIVL